tara:strand:- start:7607 stop:8086 length:480 start_codon:yes stop_codon:yes gene_type:complete
MTDIDVTPVQLCEIEAIKSLKHRYIRAMITADWGLFEDCLTADVKTSYSDGAYTFSDREQVVAFLRSTHDPAGTSALGYWHVTMPEITLAGDEEASGIWAMYHFFLDRAGNRQLEMFAYYHDRYRRENGRWKICETGYTRVIEQELDRNTVPGYQVLVP